MKPIVPAVALCTLLATASGALAQTGDAPLTHRFALGVGVGTNGGVLEGAYAFNRYLDVRAQGAAIGFDADFKSSDVKYKGKFRQFTGGADVDLHPFGNPLLVVGGFVSGERKVRVKADPTETATVKINGVTFPVSQVISLNGQADLGSTAPFAGIGFDNTFTHAGHWGFRAVGGVIFGQDPKVRLDASGPFATNPAVVAAVQKEEASLQHDVDGYRYYPVVQVGVTYRF